MNRRLRPLVQAPVQDRDVVPAIDETAHDRDAGRTGAPDDENLHGTPGAAVKNPVTER